MKQFFLLLGALTAAAAFGQSTPTDPMDAHITGRFDQRPPDRHLLVEKVQKPNEVAGEKAIYSGIGVQLAKTDNPLQLINPVAPAEYGSSEDNVVRDPVSGKVSGLKLFAIRF